MPAPQSISEGGAWEFAEVRQPNLEPKGNLPADLNAVDTIATILHKENPGLFHRMLDLSLGYLHIKAVQYLGIHNGCVTALVRRNHHVTILVADAFTEFNIWHMSYELQVNGRWKAVETNDRDTCQTQCIKDDQSLTKFLLLGLEGQRDVLRVYRLKWSGRDPGKQVHQATEYLLILGGTGSSHGLKLGIRIQGQSIEFKQDKEATRRKLDFQREIVEFQRSFLRSQLPIALSRKRQREE